MVVFPNAKINLGLKVINRRDDGFHNIESLMLPVPLCDSLEIVIDRKADPGNCDLKVYGLEVEGEVTDNICYKAYQKLNLSGSLPAVKIRLLKKIPMGAGLGGGSSDAAFTIKLLNTICHLDRSVKEMETMAAELGSDCPFFIKNETALVTGRGEVMEKYDIDFSNLYVVLVHSGVHINTAGAYSGMVPDASKQGQLSQMFKEPIATWKDTIINDFEPAAMQEHPQLSTIKKDLYTSGAIYASMTGSGSSMYGLYKEAPDLQSIFPDYKLSSFKLS